MVGRWIQRTTDMYLVDLVVRMRAGTVTAEIRAALDLVLTLRGQCRLPKAIDPIGICSGWSVVQR